MYIGDVAKQTGLTKKAIRYYEHAGIIAPQIDVENQYRDYGDADVQRLVQVSLLRQMDFSVSEISKLLDDPQMLETILREYVKKQELDIKRRQYNQQTIQRFLTHVESATVEGFTEYILELRDGVESADQREPGFIKRQLLKIFPGAYGKMIWLRFSPFLNGALDTPQKEQAWRDMVHYLDNTESLDIPEELQQMLNLYTEEDLELMADAHHQQVMRIANASPDVLDEVKQEICEYVALERQSGTLQQQRRDTRKVIDPLKNQMASGGYYEHVTCNIRILSPEYDRYLENLEKIQETLGLQYNADGSVVMEDEVK